MATGRNPLGTGRFPRRDRRRCSIIKEPPGDCRIGNELDWQLRQSTAFAAADVLVVPVVVAAKASDCRVASVVGGNSPANDERRTCLIQHDIEHLVPSVEIQQRFTFDSYMFDWSRRQLIFHANGFQTCLCLFRDTEMGNRMCHG